MMDDGVIFQPGSPQSNQSPEGDASPTAAPGIAKNMLDEVPDQPERVFDITPDLNISPLPTQPGNEPAAMDIVPPSAPIRQAPTTVSAQVRPQAIPTAIPSNVPRHAEMFQPSPNPIPPQRPVAPQPAPVFSNSQQFIVPQRNPSELPDMVPRPAPQPMSQPTPQPAPQQVSQPQPAVQSYVRPITRTVPSPSALSTDPNIEIALSSIKPKIDQATAASAANEAPKFLRRLDPNLPRDPNLKPLRTYESDVADALAREHSSVASITIAEVEKKQAQQAVQAEAEPAEEEEVSSGSGAGKKIFLLLVSLIFIGAGVIGSYYLYSKSPLAPAPAQPSLAPGEKPTVISLIPSDAYTLLAVDNLTAVTLKNRIHTEMDKVQPEGSIYEIIPTKAVNGQTMRVSAAEMIELMDIDMPDVLLRSLGQPAMIGVYTPPRDAKSLFVVVTTEFFQNTFKGMLEWETVMADDLKFYLLPDSIRGVANTDTTVTASSTSENTVAPLPTLRGKFVDRIIKNKDVRQFITNDGKVLFMYSFVDNNKLVITDKEDTLAEILTRLEKAASIR